MEKQETRRPYIKVFVFLAIFTAIEVVVATNPLAKLTQVALLLALATGKALLVAMYYMHLRYDDRRIMLIAFSPFILASALMIVLQPFISYGR
ncbi:MAG: cytochrome C oxidase subunit IV family protein [Chloroflexi bacterium]|nr:cytochrome C oxidase subunit IV family protein [Chloroflexota bacterium]